jgi:hypothetical protein
MEEVHANRTGCVANVAKFLSCANCIEGRRLDICSAGAGDSLDLISPRTSRRERVTSGGVCRPFTACLSIGLHAVAYQSRLGMNRPFSPECSISKLPSCGESTLARLESGDGRNGPSEGRYGLARIRGSGFQKILGRLRNFRRWLSLRSSPTTLSRRLHPGETSMLFVVVFATLNQRGSFSKPVQFRSLSTCF